MTESDIIRALTHRHRKDFCTERARLEGGYGIIDFCAIEKSYAHACITIYEIKTSRSDFKSDEKWFNYLPDCHKFAFVCPEGLLSLSDVEIYKDKGVGLLVVNEHLKTRFVVKPIFRPIEMQPWFLYKLLIDRLGERKVPFYSEKKFAIQDWIRGKEGNGDLGYIFKIKMLEKIRDLENERDSHSKKARQYDEVKKILESELGCRLWDGYSGIADEIKTKIREIKKYSQKLDSIQKLESLLKQIQEIDLSHIETNEFV